MAAQSIITINQTKVLTKTHTGKETPHIAALSGRTREIYNTPDPADTYSINIIQYQSKRWQVLITEDKGEPYAGSKDKQPHITTQHCRYRHTQGTGTTQGAANP